MPRPWIEYLMANPAAVADFIQWARDIDRELTVKLTTAVRNDEMAEARALVYEQAVYKKVRDVVKVEIRERDSQIQYETENERS